MKSFFIAAFLLTSVLSASSQDLKKFKLYDPAADAAAGIEAAITQARQSGKNVLIQVGGNWCIWCARFVEFVKADKKIDSLQDASYVVYHLNYSPENYNKDLLKKYQYPQRFGFPVFLVLDKNGALLHTQNSAYLEEGKGYSRDKVIDFFRDWSPRALDPATYKE
ncbi:MAG: thioredoxin family protein [Chitinophagaceae bacterium]